MRRFDEDIQFARRLNDPGQEHCRQAGRCLTGGSGGRRPVEPDGFTLLPHVAVRRAAAGSPLGGGWAGILGWRARAVAVAATPSRRYAVHATAVAGVLVAAGLAAAAGPAVSDRSLPRPYPDQHDAGDLYRQRRRGQARCENAMFSPPTVLGLRPHRVSVSSAPSVRTCSRCSVTVMVPSRESSAGRLKRPCAQAASVVGRRSGRGPITLGGTSREGGRWWMGCAASKGWGRPAAVEPAGSNLAGRPQASWRSQADGDHLGQPDTCRIRPVSLSAISTSPALSTATPIGRPTHALVPGPPSPKKPWFPSPARV
jgi:hypothetical protein